MRLAIDLTNELIVIENGQAKVTVPALWSRQITFQMVVKVEEVLCALTLY